MLAKITSKLQKSLTVFITVLLISILAVSLSSYYKSNLMQARDTAKRAMFLWKTKINTSVENNEIIDAYETNFVNLVNKGIVGEEDRLSWFETIQNTANKRGMPRVKYSISSQKLLKNNNTIAQYKGINIYKSLMTLDIEMAHEGDLFAILNDLKKSSGLYTVEKCNIEKTPLQKMNNIKMRAYCELAWYTLKSKKNGENHDKK